MQPTEQVLRSWSEVVAYLGDARRMAADTLEVKRSGHDVPSRIRVFEAHGRDWIVASARPAGDDLVLHRTALDYNASLAIGALALEDGELVVRQALSLPVAAAWLDEIVETIASEAAYLAVLLGSVADAGSPFANFAD